MPTFTTSKLLVGIGLILLFLDFSITIVLTSLHDIDPPFTFLIISSVLSITGLILVLIGMSGLAKYYKEVKIYKKTRTGVFFGIISFSSLLLVPIQNILLPKIPIKTIILVELIILTIYIFFILLMAWSFRKVFCTLADRTNRRLMHIPGKLLLIGTILVSIFYIDSIIRSTLQSVFNLWIHSWEHSWPFYLWLTCCRICVILGLILTCTALLMLTIAVFTLKTNPNVHVYNRQSQPTARPQLSSSTTKLEAKFCPYCGVPVKPKTAFCTQCGKRHKPE